MAIGAFTAWVAYGMISPGIRALAGPGGGEERSLADSQGTPQIRELFIEELAEVQGGSTTGSNPLRDLLCCSTMACCEEGQCCVEG